MLKSKLFALLILAASCTTVKAPQGTVPRRVDLDEEAFGGWLSITTPRGTLEGEFIAASADSIYIIEKAVVVAMPKADITNARVIIFKTDLGRYSIWTAVGTVSTISHGILLIFSGPVWLLTGIFTADAEGNRVNYLDYPANTWEVLSKHARFPQGLPSGINLNEIGPRPR